MASEDLKDSENAKVAKQAIDEYQKEDHGTMIFLGITVKKPDQTPNEDTNPFVFSDGTNFDFDDENFVYPWASGGPGYDDIYKCAYVETDKKFGRTVAIQQEKLFVSLIVLAPDPKVSAKTFRFSRSSWQVASSTLFTRSPGLIFKLERLLENYSTELASVIF